MLKPNVDEQLNDKLIEQLEANVDMAEEVQNAQTFDETKFLKQRADLIEQLLVKGPRLLLAPQQDMRVQLYDVQKGQFVVEPSAFK